MTIFQNKLNIVSKYCFDKPLSSLYPKLFLLECLLYSYKNCQNYLYLST